eukprot:GDKI01036130.1.p2 GENE.GDKI01036130.1~~GDKI01036130.1.p2  ORF type:complete len:320 (-),score=93.50 GDKI01036130.1:641-1534(-)
MFGYGGSPSPAPQAPPTDQQRLLQNPPAPQGQLPMYMPQAQHPGAGVGAGMMGGVDKAGNLMEKVFMNTFMYKMIFFIGACSIIIGAVADALGSLAYLEPGRLVDSIFLGLVGVVLAMIDFPFANNQTIDGSSRLVRKYARFITHQGGKALTYMFVGTVLAVNLWPSNNKVPFGNQFLMAACSLCAYTMLVSLLTLAFSIHKSNKLQTAKWFLKQWSQKQNFEGGLIWRKFVANTPVGMTPDEFARCVQEVSNRSCDMNFTDAALAIAAISAAPNATTLTEAEFREWLMSPGNYILL